MKKKQEITDVKKIEERAEKTAKGKTASVIAKIVIANVINVILLGAIFLLLSNMSEVAEKVKELKGAHLLARETSDVAIIKGDLDRVQDKVDRLSELYIDENGFGHFVEEITALRADGTIIEVSFPGSESAVSGAASKGVPVIVVFSGSREAVNASLERVLDLPFLLTPELVEIEGDASALTLKFGATILTNESFKN